MLLQVGYEGSEVIPQNRVLPTSVSATLPDQVWRLRLKIAFANIFGTYPVPAYTAHWCLLLLQDCDAIRKSILSKNARFCFLATFQGDP